MEVRLAKSDSVKYHELQKKKNGVYHLILGMVTDITRTVKLTDNAETEPDKKWIYCHNMPRN